MAQTKKRRRKKHRGTQGGRIDTRRRAARPRSREEAKARARAKRVPKADRPPTWRSAITRAVIGAVIVAVVIGVLSKKPVQGVILGLFMLVFYIPLGYLVDTMLWRRKERAKMRAREKD
jgi:uncharacterized MAPEG superfamily protein